MSREHRYRRASTVSRLITGLVVGAGVAGLAAPPELEAQEVTTYVVGYADGDETTLGLLGALVRPGGLGWQPVGSLEGYILGFPQGEETATLWSISPGVGVQYAATNGAFTARGSYQFVGGDDEQGDGGDFFGGGESGPAATLQAQYWGSRPAVEALATHNFGSNFLYTQLQAYLPIIAAPPGSIDLGAEYSFQGDFDDDDTRAQMFGPLIRWASGTGIFTSLSGGLKNNLGPADNTWYGRVAVVFAP